MKRGLLVSGTLMAAAAIVVLTHREQTRAVWLTLTSTPPATLGGALALVLCQLGFQTARLWAILPRDVAVRLGRVAYAFMLGEWTNTFTPARAGDALKVLLLSRAAPPNGQAVSVATATGAVLADKVVDAGSLVLLCLASGITGLIGAEARLHPPAPAIALGVALALTLVWLGARWARPAWVTHLRRGLSALKDPGKLVASAAFSLGAWMAEVLALGVLCHGLGGGANVPYKMIVLAVGVLNVGISVPLGAANIGVYEAALAFGLQHAGAPLPSAVAIAALHHVLELLGTNLGAAILWAVESPGNPWRTWSWGRHTLS